MFSKIEYVMILATDMDKSVDFYSKQLGLELKFKTPYWSEFKTGDTTLALHLSSKANENKESNCTIGFNVENLNATYAELSKKGVKFTMKPTLKQEEGIKLAVCIDPDGLQITIAERVGKKIKQ